MANINNYPCKKCNLNIPQNTNSICCDICDTWLHVNCAGLTLKIFKKIIKDETSTWYCTPCLQTHFPVGNLGPISFYNMLNHDTNIHTLKKLEAYNKNNNFINICSVCNKKSNNEKSIPCSTCNSLLHQKCANYKLKKLKNINELRHWSCPECINNIFPFQNIMDNDLHILSENPNPKANILNLKNLRKNFNFTKLSHQTDEETESNFNNYCDYYDVDEFIALEKEKTFSIFHTNISSLSANHKNLQILLSNLQHNFDIISLTETWDQIEKRDTFMPNNLNGYHKYNGIPGVTQNGGSGFYVKSNLNCTERTDLDNYSKECKNEFSAKWIEIQNEKENNFLIASIYRHPSSHDTHFFDYLLSTFSKLKKENKKIFITGDFNFNLLNFNNNLDVQNFLNMMYSNFYQPHIIYPTRIVPNAKPSLLDNIFSNCIYNDIISGNIIDKISDHLPNFIF